MYFSSFVTHLFKFKFRKYSVRVKLEVMRRKLPGVTEEETKNLSRISVKKRHFNHDLLLAS